MSADARPAAASPPASTSATASTSKLMPAPTAHLRLALAAAALVFGLSLGVRQSMALFIGPINTQTGLGLAAVSLAFAVGQLMWGVAQPLAGAIADRWGTGRVLAIGAVMIATGTAATPYTSGPWTLALTVGVLGAGGAGFAGPSVLMAAVNRVATAGQRGLATGIVNAGGSLGQFTIAPLAGLLLVGAGWSTAMAVLGALALAIVPLALPLRGRTERAADTGQSMGQAVRGALRDPSFGLLAAGFFVCGFHVAFIATHLPGVVAACGLPPSVGAWSLAVIGLFNMAGSLGIGWAVGRWRSKSLLSMLYAARAVVIVAFLAAPKTSVTFLVFAAAIGLTYLSTVPPTAGLVAKLHGPRYMATLFGLVMLSHQAGGFLGAWLGGWAFERSHSYDWMWAADIALALVAALLHLPIREATMRPLAPA